jgi:hypothetical protein
VSTTDNTNQTKKERASGAVSRTSLSLPGDSLLLGLGSPRGGVVASGPGELGVPTVPPALQLLCLFGIFGGEVGFFSNVGGAIGEFDAFGLRSCGAVAAR